MSENEVCHDKNTEAIDQSSFWDGNNLNWDAHRIGWSVAGGCALLTTIITIISVLGHARHYHNPAQQRQIIRILYMPAVFAIVSFFSYRFFRAYTYYELSVIVYEAFTIAAFTLLIIEYVAESSSTGKAEGALVRKEKTALPLPFCCWRYRPTKAYFMHAVKWSVLQYVVIRPGVSIAGIICEALNVLCEESYSYRHASVWLMAIDFISISIALYGLWLFYSLTHEELEGRRPFAKFLCIKLIVIFTFYQQFVFSMLQDRGVITATEFWTATNVADGLNALATTIEMVLFSLLMLWAYPFQEYIAKDGERQTTGVGRPLWDSINFSDFAIEIWHSLRFYWSSARNKDVKRPNNRTDFDTAFRLTPKARLPDPSPRMQNPWYAGAATGAEPPASATTPLFPADVHAPVSQQPRRNETSQLHGTYQPGIEPSRPSHGHSIDSGEATWPGRPYGDPPR